MDSIGQLVFEKRYDYPKHTAGLGLAAGPEGSGQRGKRSRRLWGLNCHIHLPCFPPHTFSSWLLRRPDQSTLQRSRGLRFKY